MKIITFKQGQAQTDAGSQFRIGALISESEIMDLTALVSDEDLTAGEVLECFDLDGGFIEKARAAVDAKAGRKFPVIDRAAIKICAPVPRPGKVICIGLNYRDHAEESGMPIPASPVIFSKF